MCHPDDSRPPASPDAGSVRERRDLVLTAADGNTFDAHLARAGSPRGVGVVILPDRRGLHDFYRELAGRYAEAGIDALAFDYFGRTAGLGSRGADFDAQPHFQAAIGNPDGVAADAARCAEFLRSEEGGAVRDLFTVGFCFGGGQSWRQSALIPGLAGAIGFYGIPRVAADVVDRMAAPLLMLAAGADQATTPAQAQEFADSVTAAGGQADITVYDGAPHSFFDVAFTEHAEASADAWRRVQSFIAAHTTGESAGGETGSTG